jgi:hypothetical protein
VVASVSAFCELTEQLQQQNHLTTIVDASSAVILSRPRSAVFAGGFVPKTASSDRKNQIFNAVVGRPTSSFGSTRIAAICGEKNSTGESEYYAVRA